jgi:hypothetical protein
MASRSCSWHAVRAGLSLLLVAFVGAAWATMGFERSTNIADTMAQQTQIIQGAKPQVDAMLASLKELTRAQGDIRPAFKTFSADESGVSIWRQDQFGRLATVRADRLNVARRLLPRIQTANVEWRDPL